MHCFFNYFDKYLIIDLMILLSATSGITSITSFTTVIGAPVEIKSASFSLTFSITTEIVKKYEKQHDIKRKSRTRFLG